MEYCKCPSSLGSTEKVWTTPPEKTDLEGFATHSHQGQWQVFCPFSFYLLGQKGVEEIMGHSNEKISLHFVVAKNNKQAKFPDGDIFQRTIL